MPTSPSQDTTVTILCRTPEIAKALVEVLYLNCVEGLIGDCLADRAVSVSGFTHRCEDADLVLLDRNEPNERMAAHDLLTRPAPQEFVPIQARPHAVLADFADVASFVQADGSTGPVPHMFENLAAAQAACPHVGMVVSAAEAESMAASPSP